MKIAFLTPEYPYSKVALSAGIGTSIKNLVDALVKKGVQVTVFVCQQNTSNVFQEKGVTFHIISRKTYKIGTWYFYRKYLQRYINAVVLKENIDILEAPDWTGITAFMKLKAPLVIRFHGTDAYFCKLENRKQKFKNFVFEKLSLKKAVAYISPTNFTKQETVKLFSLNHNRISVIPNGINLDYFKNKNPSSFNSKTLLYVGTLIRKKGVLELARIFNNIIEKEPDAKLVLIGSDSFDITTGSKSTYKLMLDTLTDAAKANTEYLGKIPYTQINNHFKKAHVCVFPSFAETFGMVTIEAMALQKPVVNTSIGWANEIIDHNINGYLIHPSQTKAYAKQIVHLFSDNFLSLKIGKTARQKVEFAFDINVIATKNINFYKAIILESKS